MYPSRPIFADFRLPALAVICPKCHAPAGQWCKPSSANEIEALHRRRIIEAEIALIAAYGPDVTLYRQGRSWIIDPEGLKRD